MIHLIFIIQIIGCVTDGTEKVTHTEIQTDHSQNSYNNIKKHT